MSTKVIAWVLIVCSLLSAAAELCGWLLPTLSWSFSVARQFSFLNCPVEWCPAAAADGRVQWFGWAVVLSLLALGIYLSVRVRDARHASRTQRAWARFRRSKLGMLSLWLLGGLLLLSGADRLLVGKRALAVQTADGSWYFPAFRRHPLPGRVFGLTGNAALTEADYRRLHADLGRVGGPLFVLMPPIPFEPAGDTTPFPVQKLPVRGDVVYAPDGVAPYNGTAFRLYVNGDVHSRIRYRDGRPVGGGASEFGRELPYRAPSVLPPSPNRCRPGIYLIHFHPAPPLVGGHLLGTDSYGQDIAASLIGGFQVNVKAALFFLPTVYALGISIGMLMGYLGGWLDLVLQRVIEVLSQLPFLLVVMAVTDMFPTEWRGLPLSLLLMSLLGWMPIAYLVRTCTMREKARDYVMAARAVGAGSFHILLRHILPNLLPPILTSLPFNFAFLVLSLSSLDYLGFGMPDTCASWGRLLNDGLAHLSAPWVASSATAALILVLLLITFIGETVRSTKYEVRGTK